MHIHTKKTHNYFIIPKEDCFGFSVNKREKVRSRNLFFELQYIFNQPNIDSKRKRRSKYSLSSYRTQELSPLHQSPNIQHKSNNRTQVKKIQRNVQEFIQTHPNEIANLQNKGIIHSRRENRKIRSNSSLREHKLSIESAKRQIKTRIKDRIVEGKGLIKIYAEPKPTFIPIGPISYRDEGRQTSRQRVKNQSNNAINIRKINPIQNKQNSNKIQYKKVQGKLYRPWSPINQDHFEIDQILTSE